MSTTTLRTSTDPQLRLRRALVIDGVVSGAMGVMLALAASALSDPLGLPNLLLRLAGVSLLPYAALLFYLSARATIPRQAAWGVVGLNLLWVAASVLLPISGWVDPTGLGVAFVLGQALAVAAFADLQYLGLRRSV